jgi:hypothetical protein
MIRVAVFFLTFILIILYYVFMLGEIILLLT